MGGRRHANAPCRMPRQPGGASPHCHPVLCGMSRGWDIRGGGSSCCVAAAASRHAGKWRWRMRRIMYLWLPRWPIDRLRLSHRTNSAAPAEEAPFATVTDAAGRRLLAAVNPAATAAGPAPGMPLADALTFLPRLVTALVQPTRDAAALCRPADRRARYSPCTAPAR